MEAKKSSLSELFQTFFSPWTERQKIQFFEKDQIYLRKWKPTKVLKSLYNPFEKGSYELIRTLGVTRFFLSWSSKIVRDNSRVRFSARVSPETPKFPRFSREVRKRKVPQKFPEIEYFSDSTIKNIQNRSGDWFTAPSCPRRRREKKCFGTISKSNTI